jgi:putative ATPase
MIKEILQKPNIRYDKDGDNHYDTISAFIKSMRGSDPDATIYYLARMIEAGEDPKFIARRIMISAAEDVSNADPMALVIATSASLTVERIGMPEGRIALAQAALYIAAAPKSNSAITAIDSAMQYIRQHPSNDVPKHLRDAHYKSAAKLGHGVDYVYPHDYKNDWCPQQYLPDDVKEFFYTNSHNGYEAVQADHLNRIRNEYDGTKKS